MKKFMLLVLLTAYNYALNPVSLVEAIIFGNQNASEFYQSKIKQALQEYGYGAVAIPVKKMNSLADKLIGNQLYSFTLFGIWLNEKLLNNCDEEIRTWLLYHEVAHNISNHHAKAIGLVLTLLPALALTYKSLRSEFSSRLVALCGTSLLSYGLFKYAVQPYVKEQEKEADLITLRLLNSTNRTSVVQKYLSFLKTATERIPMVGIILIKNNMNIY